MKKINYMGFNFNEKEECIVYLYYLKKVDDGVYNAYVDFRLEDDLKYFIKSTQTNSGFGLVNTFIEFSFFATNKRLRTGCYYKLNLDLINKKDFIVNEESFFIGRSYNMTNMLVPNNDSEELLQRHELLDANDLSLSSNNLQNFPGINFSSKNLVLNVRDVKQANWNELLDGDIIKIVYDLGARLRASKNEVACIFNARVNELKRDKPILIISHWDMDHIHCLRYVDIQTIKECFSAFICVDMMKSVTSNRICTDVKNALGESNVYVIAPESRTNGINMHLKKRLGNIALYVGERSTNINFSGLCMFVHGYLKTVNFTGDVKLIQAKDIYDKELTNGINTSEHILIAPHHGGDYDSKSRYYSSSTTEVIISVGDGNTYKHPEQKMLKYLEGLCGGNVKKTNESYGKGIQETL